MELMRGFYCLAEAHFWVAPAGSGLRSKVLSKQMRQVRQARHPRQARLLSKAGHARQANKAGQVGEACKASLPAAVPLHRRKSRAPNGLRTMERKLK